MIESTKSSTLMAVFGIGVLVALIGGVLVPNSMQNMKYYAKNMGQNSAEHNKKIVNEKNEGIKNLLAEGRYKCCMKEPCFRCFSKPGAQDKELVCDCMVDIYNGKHPCGECIGEILEGEGNPLMAEYFAIAIAEKLGEQHLATLRQIISEKYGMPIEKQI